MKSIKLFSLVLAGVLFTITMFAFKSEEPKKEYLSLSFVYGNFYVLYPHEEKKIPLLVTSSNLNTIFFEQHKIINGLAKEGWILKTSGTYLGGVSNPILYFERTKQ